MNAEKINPEQFLDIAAREKRLYMIKLDDTIELELPDANGTPLEITYKAIPGPNYKDAVLMLFPIPESNQRIEGHDSFILRMSESVTIVNSDGHWWAV